MACTKEGCGEPGMHGASILKVNIQLTNISIERQLRGWVREDSIRELTHGLYHNQGDNPGHRAIVLGLKKKIHWKMEMEKSRPLQRQHLQMRQATIQNGNT